MAKFHKKTPAQIAETVLQPAPATIETESSNDSGPKTFDVSSPQEVTNRHQFDDAGIQYEHNGRKTRLFAVLGLLALLIVAAIFATTPQGQSLILRVTNQTSSTTSSEASTSSHSNTSTSNILPTIPARDFSEANQIEIREQLSQDIDIMNEVLSSPTGFDTPDWNLELGL